MNREEWRKEIKLRILICEISIVISIISIINSVAILLGLI